MAHHAYGHGRGRPHPVDEMLAPPVEDARPVCPALATIMSPCRPHAHTARGRSHEAAPHRCNGRGPTPEIGARMRAKRTPVKPAANGRIDRPGFFDGPADRKVADETPVDPTGGATTVYYLHDADHTLLYVGITLSARGLERLHEHAASKPWWHDVAYASMEHFDSRTEAEQREAEAIERLHPIHNVVHPNAHRVNDYGVRLCACGCRCPAPQRGMGATRPECRRRAHRERQASGPHATPPGG